MAHVTSLEKVITLLMLCTLFTGANANDQEAYDWATALTLESISNLEGGNKTGTRNLANLDVSLAIDTQSAGWWNNGTVFGYLLGTYGKPPSELTGEFQTLSNIEAYDNLTLYEVWYQHSFADGAVKLLAGLHDYNSTFYSLESAGLFTLSSFGIGPDVAQVGPSIFPTTAAAIHLTLAHNDQYFLLAAYDGIPGDPAHPRGTHVVLKKSDGILTAMELGLAQEKNYKFGVGGWETSSEVESPVDGNLLDENRGYYLIGEKYFTENLAAFFQYSRADTHKNQLEVYSGVGVTYSEIWVDDDSVGIGYAQAKNGSAFLSANPDLLAAENIIELTYARPLMDKLHLQTSLYYVENPSMNPVLDNSVALGIRLYIDL
ncbi:MAG: hypothetical protein EOO52_11715 [Gammaproteobacteria bacterium]|nr:MAG: hypothetical protein EOO52_11715 [Gammaproteobacteria bacterium]